MMKVKRELMGMLLSMIGLFVAGFGALIAFLGFFNIGFAIASIGIMTGLFGMVIFFITNAGRILGKPYSGPGPDPWEDAVPNALVFLWKLSKWAILVIVVLSILAVLINSRDEPLSDEARLLLSKKPAQVPDDKNIFWALMGFDAPEGDDIFKAGKTRIGGTDHPAGELHWQQSTPAFDCPVIKEEDYFNYINCIHSQKDRLEKTLHMSATLVQRYYILQDLPVYDLNYYIDRCSACLSGEAAAMKVQRLLMAQAILNIESGNTRTGLNFFKKDMALWRRVLENKGNILHSMFAIAHLTWDVQGLSFLLSSLAIKLNDPTQTAESRALLIPL
jgi:hypothetical protein